MEKENYLLEGLNDTDIDWLISVGLKTPISANQILCRQTSMISHCPAMTPNVAHISHQLFSQIER